MSPRITILIPTLAQASRAADIEAAIQSCHSQRGVDVSVIVAINGGRYDGAVKAALEGDRRVTTLYDSIGSLPRAIAAGRAAVRTDFFAFLDDDDRLLPDTLADRIALLSDDPRAAVAVSNGFRYSTSESAAIFGDPAAFRRIEEDPLEALLEANWLASCGGVYRSSLIPPAFYDDCVQYCEWTYFAFRLAAGFRVRFDAAPRFLIRDSPQSLSKMPQANVAQLLLWAKVRPLLAHRPDLASRLRAREADAHHAASEHFRSLGATGSAWKHHALSFVAFPTRGLRYAAYTRHLMVDLFRRELESAK